MWCLDAYRRVGVPPRGMGKLAQADSTRLDAVYRGKGNWFATALALLLGNQTSHQLASRGRVHGFSQMHQIDVAWPPREVDPLICLETKVTGAPAYGHYPARKATADWTNRRKELKFAATDLKLFRRQQETVIEHWDVWRSNAAPKTFFLWAARMSPRDKLNDMVQEVQYLVKSYLEGAGIIAWETNSNGDGYQPMTIPPVDRVSTADDVLYRIASEIKLIAPPGQQPPPPQTPTTKLIDVTAISEDPSSTQ